MSRKADGTGELYQVRSGAMFLIRGSIGTLTAALSRADQAGVLTSIERMRINSAIQALKEVSSVSTDTWLKLVKPKLVEGISSGKIVPHKREDNDKLTSDETRQKYGEDEGVQGNGQEPTSSKLPDEESGGDAEQTDN